MTHNQIKNLRKVPRQIRNLLIYPALLLAVIFISIFARQCSFAITLAFILGLTEAIISISKITYEKKTEDFRALWASYSIKTKYTISIFLIYVASSFLAKYIGLYVFILNAITFAYFRLYLYEAVKLIEAKTNDNTSVQLSDLKTDETNNNQVKSPDRNNTLQRFKSILVQTNMSQAEKAEIIEKSEFSSWFSSPQSITALNQLETTLKNNTQDGKIEEIIENIVNKL